MTKRIAAALVAAAALAILPLAAQAQSAGDAACLQLGRIDGFSPIKGNERAIIVTDKTSKRFKVNFFSPCAGVDFNMGLGIKTLANTRLACVSRGDYVLSRDPGVAGNRCPISSVELYTPAMAAADKAAAAPKSK